MPDRRRMLLAGFALAMPGATPWAAAGPRPLRIALLPDLAVDLDPEMQQALLETLRAAGRTEGRDFVLVHSGVGYGRDFELAVQRIVEAKPDLVFACATGYARAAQRLLPRTPIVMWASGFPVEAGLARSLARPGWNVTGMSGYAATGLFAKHAQLLRDAKPSLRRIGYVWAYMPPFNAREETDVCIAEVREIGRRLRLDARVFEIAQPAQVETMLAAVERDDLEALVLTTGASLWPARQRILDVSVRRRMLTLSDYRWTSVDPAPTFAYGPSDRSMIVPAAAYVERILWGGVRPGDLPIQRPARYEFVVNLRNARAIGAPIPASMLQRADVVLE